MQPARGYNIDPKTSYHDPALPLPHAYLAFHVWLARHFGARAVVHVGKHGNLEWLPGKALSLARDCFPEVCAGAAAAIYPSSSTIPARARRPSAAFRCHRRPSTPPLTRGDAMARSSGLTRRRPSRSISPPAWTRAGWNCARARRDRPRAGTASIATPAQTGKGDDALAAVDNYLCELKEMQIRDGLHVFARLTGKATCGVTCWWRWRARRAASDEAGQASLLRAVATDLGPRLRSAGLPHGRSMGRAQAAYRSRNCPPIRGDGGRHGRAAGTAAAALVDGLARSPGSCYRRP